MSLPIIVLDDAENELEVAVTSYEEKAPGLGADFRAEIDRAFGLVSALPRAGKRVAGTRAGEVRQVFVKRFPFGVVYLLEPAVIWVVAVAHHRRLPGIGRADFVEPRLPLDVGR